MIERHKSNSKYNISDNIKKHSEDELEEDKLFENEIKSFKNCIYVFKDNNNKYLYTFHKKSNNNIYALRCKDRTNRKGRACYNLLKIISVTQQCSVEYENHNYVQNKL